jgi:serine protease
MSRMCVHVVFACLVGVLVAGATLPVVSQESLEPRVPALKSDPYDLPAHTPVVQIVVKFHEGTRVRLRGGSLTTLPRSAREALRLRELGLSEEGVRADFGRLRSLIASSPLVHGGLRRLFTQDEASLESRKLRAELRSGRELADLALYYQIPLPEGTVFADTQGLVAALNELDAIEIAYADPPAEPAAVKEPRLVTAAAVTPNFQSLQGYLNAAPQGIDAFYAWGFAGGRGSGKISIVDIEQGWRTTHEDLPALFHTWGINSSATDNVNHGTAVLGELAARDNGLGVTGIVNRAKIGYSSANQQVSWFTIYSVANAVNNAGDVTGGPGGLILIEQHKQGPANSSSCTCNTSQCDYIPMEYWQAEYDAIAQAVVEGNVVVEAGGNGSSNLDDAAYSSRFNRSYRDSGAIIVAASFSSSRNPTCWTNWGSRIDVHAWGENVMTLGYGTYYNGGTADKLYTSTFGGTSSASPIVTGAAASLQGVAINLGHGFLHPKTVRQILRDTGTPQVPGSKNIGPMPNLRGALDLLIADRPNCVGLGGAYISHFTEPACTGAEHYYTPYDGYNGGVRRSWDGQGCAGTLLRTVTNRSWRDSAGECHDSWSSGNTLNEFVAIYRPTCACGESNCAPAEGAYISHFTELGCTGEEHYYTPYDQFSGQRRSWDGGGCLGSVLRTVTNRSYRDWTGECHDEWPDGNTLSDFVKVYR